MAAEISVKFLDLQQQYQSLQEELDHAIAQVIREAAFVGGHFVSEFEESFASYQQGLHCVSVANGTDAIEIALESLDLPKGSEVIVPANTFIASSEAVTRSGLRVVFADTDPDNFTLDVDDVERRISPSTSAIIAVHLYGHPCNMDALLALANRHGLRVIEDCAQAHGAEYKGRRVGALGDIGTFSFYPGKNLGAYGDGGALLTNDAALSRRCRMIANHGRVDKYDHQFEARNSRLDGLQAAILSVKLKHLDSWIDRRNVVAEQYIKGLKGISAFSLPMSEPDVRHAFHLFVVRCNERDELSSYLANRGVQTGIHYPIALPDLKAYSYLAQPDPQLRPFQNSTLLSLPMGEHLTETEVAIVVDAMRAFAETINR